ncbi:MAG: hypothetical protein JNL83_31210 [Myxococcales bacterium]|nr:hypothetical protein [Myxococcales bacterium]
MSFVILLAVLLLIVLMFRAALGPSRPTSASTAAFAEGLAEGAAEAAVRGGAASLDAPHASATCVPTVLHDEPLALPELDDHPARHHPTNLPAEADDPSACHGYDADDRSDPSDDADVSCDSGSGDWSWDDD